MEYRIVEVDREWAADRARAWAYPREITPEEIERSRWFSYGSWVIFWFDRCLPCEVTLHVVVEPMRRGRVYPRKLLYAFDVIAELLGAARIVGWFDPGSHAEGIVRRLGWQLLDTTTSGRSRAWVRNLPTIEPSEECHDGEVEPTPEAEARTGS